MSDYVYASVWEYFSGGTQIDSSTAGGTITDVDNDDLFNGTNPGPDTVAFATPTQYYGTIEIGGVTYPVFQETNVFANLLIVSTTTDNPGTSITPSNINIGATFPICFATGTQIATPTGNQAVETLKIGDTIRTADGRAVPIKWIGRQTLFPAFNPSARRSLVRVAAGALGGGLPERDLTVTADHALLIDGLLINAGALVNGTTVTEVPRAGLGQSYTVYHIETETHDIILAEGTAAETYVDHMTRRAYDNYGEYLELYGEERTIAEAAHPRISTARQVPHALKARLAGAIAA